MSIIILLAESYVIENFPSQHEPGEIFNYNTLSVHLLSVILSRATGMSLLYFADNFLFKSLSISSGQWLSDFHGHSYGGHSAHFRTNDMSKLGNLYLNKGFWKGKQIISPNFIAESTSKQNTGGLPENSGYGYLWWVTSIKGYSAYFASGYGGQYIYVVDDLSFVAVITSNRDRPHPENKGIIEGYIIPAILNG